MITRVQAVKHSIEIPNWIELASTVRGARDPILVGPRETSWNTRTPDGLGSLHLARTGSTTVEVQAWGPGADWMITQAPKLLGSDDDLNGFTPPKGRLADLWTVSYTHLTLPTILLV